MTVLPRMALVTGAEGQLGAALRAAAPSGWRVVGAGKAALDVTDPAMVRRVLTRELPAIVIHAAAYTAVDAAEREPEAAEAINAGGTGHVAAVAREIGARFIYVSTDYVFDGARGRPYAPADVPNPVNVYGRTKWAGERGALGVAGLAALVVRTAWVYSSHGRNFALTMLEGMRRGEDVWVVADQVGTPTWARSLAEALWQFAARPELGGIYHWTDAGVASWYDFAVAIHDEALALGLLDRAVSIRPIRSGERPVSAARPPYSVLDASASWAALAAVPSHWRANLRRMLQELAP